MGSTRNGKRYSYLQKKGRDIKGYNEAIEKEGALQKITTNGNNYR